MRRLLTTTVQNPNAIKKTITTKNVRKNEKTNVSLKPLNTRVDTYLSKNNSKSFDKRLKRYNKLIGFNYYLKFL